MPLPATRFMLAFVVSAMLAFAAFTASAQQPEPEADDQDEAASATSPQRRLTKDREDALREQLSGASVGQERWLGYDELIRGYVRAGRVAESVKLRDDALNDDRLSTARRSVLASSLAMSQALIGDYPRSQRLIARAKSLAQEARPDDIETLFTEPSYSFLRAEAEVARRHQARHDIALGKTRETSNLAWANFNNPSFSEKRRRAAANELLNNVQLHVILLVQNNRRQEALSYVQEIERRLEARPDLQPTQHQIAMIQAARAIALCSFDDYEGALAAINTSLATYQRANLGEQYHSYGLAVRIRLLIALALGRITEHVADADAMTRTRAINPMFGGTIPAGEADSLVLAARGQWAAAATRLIEQLDRDTRFQGTESPFFRYRSSMRMLYQLNDPQGGLSVSDIERYVGRQTNTDDWPEARYRGIYVEDGALANALERLMRWQGDGSTEQAQALAFRIAELLRVNASQGALTDGAARLAASDPRLRALIEQEQIVRFDQATNRRAFAVASTRLEQARASGDDAVVQRQAEDADKKEKSLQASVSKLKELRRQIASQFPVYRELISPEIPDSARLGAVLRPGEAYVNLYAGRLASYVFVVLPSGRLHAQRLETTRSQLIAQTAALRAGFETGVPPTRRNPLGGFDPDAAHAIYRAVIAPIEAQLQGAATIYLSSGQLSSVPWNVLLMRPWTDLGSANWWASSVTPVQMPSASALVLARTRGAQRASAPFIAFADPAFDGATASRDGAVRSSVRPRALRSPAGAVASAAYRTLAPLPETLDEVRAIGVALNAPEQSIVHGPAAARSTVLKQDFSNARVVAFATHGLLPGELPGLFKPGLAMSYEGQGLDDSLLTIDDIIALRLNADWVVLSACNTGTTSGAAGDTMSALSRGFFASGARTLLVTQWAVESESATQLTIGLFKAYAADPALSKAQALARVQRDMMAGKLGEGYAHPYFWAPYFIAGDAAR
ncbi:CHAT domain-containing protein [Variovorax sp. KK3]|uniref:CHAT domain-containing protein n=1 Tax=Variovorax sp. KK3 TaxID=1855728 RepID=UPI00097C98E1|nr:CHAT domain-containing protein [Variovorax sp. KK3]